MYHLCKQTRAYDGTPYCGYSSNNIPCEFEKLEDAREKVKELNNFNPVGWNIWDSETGLLIEGFDFMAGDDFMELPPELY